MMNDPNSEHELDLGLRLEYEFWQSKEDLRELDDMIKMYVLIKDKNWEPLIDNFFYATLKLIDNLFILKNKQDNPNTLNFNSLVDEYKNLANKYINIVGRTPKNIFNSTLFHEPEKVESPTPTANIKNKAKTKNAQCFPFFTKNKEQIRLEKNTKRALKKNSSFKLI